jgi:death-on-curing protein
LTKGGGRAGLISEQNLLSALARPYSGYHRPIARKCAALLHSMVKNHPFVDANKRTAWLVTNILIVRSGYMLDLELGDRIDDLVVGVAEDNIKFDDLVAWFRVRLSK